MAKAGGCPATPSVHPAVSSPDTVMESGGGSWAATMNPASSSDGVIIPTAYRVAGRFILRRAEAETGFIGTQVAFHGMFGGCPASASSICVRSNGPLWDVWWVSSICVRSASLALKWPFVGCLVGVQHLRAWDGWWVSSICAASACGRPWRCFPASSLRIANTAPAADPAPDPHNRNNPIRARLSLCAGPNFPRVFIRKVSTAPLPSVV